MFSRMTFSNTPIELLRTYQTRRFPSGPRSCANHHLYCLATFSGLMSLLFKNLRIHQIFGANTDVGKTVLTSALVRASAASGHNVYYLKPVSTGPMSDADDEYVVYLTENEDR